MSLIIYSELIPNNRWWEWTECIQTGQIQYTQVDVLHYFFSPRNSLPEESVSMVTWPLFCSSVIMNGSYTRLLTSYKFRDFVINTLLDKCYTFCVTTLCSYIIRQRLHVVQSSSERLTGWFTHKYKFCYDLLAFMSFQTYILWFVFFCFFLRNTKGSFLKNLQLRLFTYKDLITPWSTKTP